MDLIEAQMLPKGEGKVLLRVRLVADVVAVEAEDPALTAIGVQTARSTIRIRSIDETIVLNRLSKIRRKATSVLFHKQGLLLIRHVDLQIAHEGTLMQGRQMLTSRLDPREDKFRMLEEERELWKGHLLLPLRIIRALSGL